jgi:hypothetical protein
VTTARIPSTLLRRALRLALCYVVAIQALVAAYATALAVVAKGDVAAGFAICHNAGADTASNPHQGSDAKLPCALCAVAASVASLPAGAGPVVATPISVSHHMRPPHHAAVPVLPTPRAGLARAPPLLV